MAASKGDRALQFPAIEKKHGKPIDFWFSQLKKLKSDKYADQLALLMDKYGFSRTHANAMVMYHRGSTTSQRVAGPDAYLKNLSSTHQQTIREIFDAILKKHPRLELVVAWNQPMLRNERGYVFGLSAAKNHITINPWSDAAMTAAQPKLSSYVVNKKTFQVPADWKVDSSLLNTLVKVRLSELRS